jgi:Pentapeptide repeats (8 copies)
MAWGLAAVLAAVLVGIGGLGVQLQPCWAAKHRAAGDDSHSAALRGAFVYQGDLRYRNLRGANLSGTALPGWTNLTGADLTDANLQGASLDAATLNSAHLRRANLRRANLHAADLMNTDLRGADLSAANLRAADFWNADLRDAKVAGAQYDAQTRWPEGFDPRNHGAILVRATSETPPSHVAADAFFIAALFFIFGGLVAWISTTVQLAWRIGTGEARDPSWRGRFKVFLACVVFGAGYGAAFGSVYGPVLWLPSGDGFLWAVENGAICGAALGAFGGGVTGFAGNIIGWRVGWVLAGGLGSAASAACVWAVACIAAAWEPNQVFREKNLIDGALWCSGVILIGGLLGMALDRALRTGRSFVPGVQRLAATINGEPQPPQESARGSTAEIG